MKTTINELSEKMAIKVERYIRLHIQPKPKWLPNFMWKKILQRLLILEELKNV